MAIGKISVKDLDFEAILGVLPFERERTQPLRLNFSLWLDFEPIANTDSIEETVDYAKLSDDLIHFICKEKFGLIETLVYRSAQRLLAASPRIIAASVRLEKPEAIPQSQGSEAEIKLEKSA